MSGQTDRYLLVRTEATGHEISANDQRQDREQGDKSVEPQCQGPLRSPRPFKRYYPPFPNNIQNRCSSRFRRRQDPVH
jgi:hypothetical protein